MLKGLGAILDPYTRQARLEPALLTLSPLFVTVIVWFPALYTFVSALAGGVVAIGIVALLANVARFLGRRAEGRLRSDWGGAPTTQWLRHRDHRLGALTLANYHAFLARHVPGWIAPTAEEERADPGAADRRYEDAVNWLREHARDTRKYPLVFKELISYGFRRNLYALRIIGLPLATLCTLASAALIHRDWADLADLSPLHAGAFAFAVIGTIAWMMVRPSFVKDAGDAYAQRLLAVCIEPDVSRRTAQSRRRVRDADAASN